MSTKKGPYVDSWEDFAKRAENLYLNNPNKVSAVHRSNLFSCVESILDRYSRIYSFCVLF